MRGLNTLMHMLEARAAPPREMEGMEEESIEVQAVRTCIAEVAVMRAAHADVVSQKDVTVRELNELREVRAGVQARLTAHEREIALNGSDLPDEPFPEDAEIVRLDRHLRIRQERVRVCDAKVRESQEEVDAQIRAVEAAWNALGAALSERLIDDFRKAALALRESQLAYRSLSHHFLRTWADAAWKHFDYKLAIADPMIPELILNPQHTVVATDPAHARYFERFWPASALEVYKRMDALRAEIDALKSE